MSDSIDDTQIHMRTPEKAPKYGQCNHCWMFSANLGKCPFCGKGEVR
jgi:hypothetical protein